MAFTEFEYTKSWRNADDFATYENNEERVRDDMQLLFDEAAAAINRLITEIKAGNIPFNPTAGVDSTDVQNALENIQAQIAQVALGNLPDDSITAAKLKADSVLTDKLVDECVTQSKLGLKAVAEKNMDDNSVAGRAIIEKTITRDKMAEDAYDDKADLVDGKVKPEQLSQKIITVASGRALELADAGALLLLSGVGLTLTIPTNSDVQLPIGTEITLYRACAEAITLAVAEGVTLQTPGGRVPLGRQYTFVRLKKLQANVWACDTLDIAGSDDIADDSILERHIADGAVGKAAIADGAVETAKIANGAVTWDKLAPNAAHKTATATLTTAGWSGNSQTVSVTGITANNDFFCCAAPASFTAWNKAGIRPTAQGAGTITFSTDKTPTANVTVNIIIFK